MLLRALMLYEGRCIEAARLAVDKKCDDIRGIEKRG